MRRKRTMAEAKIYRPKNGNTVKKRFVAAGRVSPPGTVVAGRIKNNAGQIIAQGQTVQHQGNHHKFWVIVFMNVPPGQNYKFELVDAGGTLLATTENFQITSQSD